MKSIIQKIGLLIAMLSVTISAFAYDFVVDGIYYSINDDKETVSVTSSKSEHDTEFRYDYSGEVIIPETVTYKNKTYVVNSIKQVNSNKNLISIKLPNTITTLPSFAFYKCTALNNVVLSENLTSIPYHCFSTCSALGKIEIPESVTEIGEGAFQQCTSISSLTIPSNVTEIDKDAFKGCTALSSITFTDSEKTLKIGPGINSTNPFNDCPLYQAYIGRNITDLNTSSRGIFAAHSTLQRITFGKSVTTISYDCFLNCKKLTTINFEGENLKTIRYGAFSGCENLLIESEALKNVQTIEANAFIGCKKLKSIELPKIQTLGNKAFASGNTDGNLESIYLGDNLVEIPNYCFGGQKNLKNVYIGNGLTTINEQAFWKNTNLTNIYIFSDNLVSIAANAIPTTVSKIYVPVPSRYDNLLKDYYTDCLMTIDNSNSVYSGSVPNLSYTNNVIGTSVSFDSPSFKVDAGSYNTKVDVTFSYGLWNSVAKIPCSYTITPAPLTIIANDASRKYGEENPEFTCSFFGFKNGETADVLAKLPIAETTATTSSNAGTYPIIPTGAEAQNYTFNYERGTLTITKADQTIDWDQKFDKVTVGDIIELTATSSAGLAIKYTSTDESIAEIFTQGGKKCVEFLKPGKVSIRANQEGNENYNEADRVSKSITVEEESGIADIITDNSEIKVRHIGTSIVVENANNKDVAVYSTAGATLFKTSVYNGEEINLSAGIYVVKCGKQVLKVRI